MPRRRTFSRRAPRRFRRRFRRQYRRTRFAWASAAGRPSAGFPKNRLVKMTYGESLLLNPANTGVVQYFAYAVPTRTTLTRTLNIPSFTTIRLTTQTTSGEVYLDAWYLKDMGISDSYQQGLDAETDGILTDYLGTDAQQIGWVLIGIAAILFAFKGGK